VPGKFSNIDSWRKNMSKDIIRFIKQKEYKFIKELGQGGLGKTILILDSEIGEQFVCKKYSPYDESLKDEYYDYFKNEIKVMFQVNHSNIIRIFNYYLYPEQRTDIF
jgi:serine/threonine-protein kinase